ncbi:MAG: 3-dehydroquinate synthase [Alphaproteobacteria bacterium]|nr:3-dehydroquinate synthase [Alphaproteobacteria bacterium]
MSDAQRLRVELGARSYDIVVGSQLLAQAGTLIASVVRQRRVIVVTDATVARLHLEALRQGLALAGLTAEAVVVPPGEATKNFAHFQQLCEDILALGVERATPIMALGGGVVGDLAGFAAATLLRGLDYIQVPTTLLAQVDSSVGGKTAIDTRLGKNLVGAFHQPVLVIADIDTLRTLPYRELLAGYAEVVKYGLIRDRRFYEWLEARAGELLAGDPALRREAVLHSCAAKAAVVAADEREAGERALLNFGHTFGHALEAATGFGGALLHGEAVALGMCMAFDLSTKLRLCPADAAARVRRHFAAVGLRTEIGELDADNLLALMRKDKKVADGRISLILARDIGQAFVSRDVEPEMLCEFLRSEMRTLAAPVRAV